MMKKDNHARGKRYKAIGRTILTENEMCVESEIKPPKPFDYLSKDNHLFIIKSKKMRKKQRYTFDFSIEELNAIDTYQQNYEIGILLIIIKSNRTRKYKILGISDFKTPFKMNYKVFSNHPRTRIIIKKESRFY